MAVRVAKENSVFNRLNNPPVTNKVCRFWLKGRCNRNPCPFMHRESPSLQTTQQPRSAPHDDSHRNQPTKLIWTNPNSPISKNGSSSSNEGGRLNGRLDQSTLAKVLANNLKNGSSSSNEGGKLNGRIDRSTRAKVLANTCKSGHGNQQASTAIISGDENQEASTALRSGPEKAQPYTMLAKLEGHAKAITGISLPSGGDKLYSGGKDGNIRAWDCSSGQCAGSVTIDGEVGCLAAEGPCLFAGIQNGVKAWNLQDHTEFNLSGPAGLVCSIVVDEDMLFAGMEDGTILVWKWHPETKTPELAAALKEHTGAVCSLVLGADCRLYSGSRDSTIKVWDRQKLQCLQTLYGHKRDVMSLLCWDSYLLSASLDKTLKVWATAESGSIEVVYEHKEDHEVIALCGIHDAEAKPILLCSFSDNTVRLYDLPSFNERGRIFSKHQVQVIEMGGDGLFLTGDATGEVTVWKLLGDPCETTS